MEISSLGMKDKLARRKEGKSHSELLFTYEAITVGSGRHAEPYILAFHYKSDNVAGKALGTLFGFFEVEVHDEDAAYIVNFLASVAKKEYFTNPRRPAEDGFETALHKINVALAEIAKEGNVSWLGHLHGILGAVSEGTVYFSATGDGVLSLAREESFRPISDGLAENLSEPHPLKTFTEVSSGQLQDHDVLLAVSPSIWTLFTPDELKKNLARFTPEEFSQFLKTALINELPIAGAVIVRVTQALATTPTPTSDLSTVSSDALVNVWSQQSFEKVRAARLAATKESELQESPTPESQSHTYVDRKTGHIYVQGEDDPADNHTGAWKARIDLARQSLGHTWMLQTQKWRRGGRRWRKQLGFFLEGTSVVTTRLARSLMRRTRVSLRRLREARAARRPVQAQPPTNSLFEPKTTEALSAPLPTLPSQARLWKTYFTHAQALRVRFSSLSAVRENAWVNHLRIWMAQWLNWGARQLHALALRLTSLTPLHTTRRLWWLGGLIGVIGLSGLGWYLSHRETVNEESQASNSPTPPPVAPPTPEANEPQALRLGDGQKISLDLHTPLIALTTINNIPFAVTTTALADLRNGTIIQTPESSTLATAMDDLDALFLLGASGTLRMYTVANQKFETSSLPLPLATRVDAMGTYLTYLYTLDRSQKTIYRFPRAEGGFGPPTQWSRETLAVSDHSPLVIGEMIALLDTEGKINLYERGRKIAIVLSGTRQPVEARAFTFDKKTGDILVLDPSHERVVRYAPTGALIAQYFHTSFQTATALTITDGTLTVAQPDGLTAFPLP